MSASPDQLLCPPVQRDAPQQDSAEMPHTRGEGMGPIGTSPRRQSLSQQDSAEMPQKGGGVGHSGTSPLRPTPSVGGDHLDCRRMKLKLAYPHGQAI